MTRAAVAAILASVALASACEPSSSTPSSAPAGSVVRDSAGVRIVEWGAPDTQWQVSADPPLSSTTLGSADADALHGIQAVLGVDSTSVIVAEAAPARLLHLDFSRGELRVLGGTGAGPGEYTSILWAGRRSEREGYLVFDARLKRLSRLASDLSLSETVSPQRVTTGPGALPDIRGEFADGRLVASSPLLAAKSPGSNIVRQPLRLFALSAAGEVLDSLTTVLGDEALVIGGVVTRPSFLKKSSLVVGASEVHLAEAISYEVRSFGADGRLLRVVRGTDRRRSVPDSLLQRFRELDESALPATVTYPEVSELLVDDVGRLWLGRYAQDGESAEWSVSDPDGALVATVVTPPDFRLKSVWRGLLFGVARGPLGEESVQVFGLAQP